MNFHLLGILTYDFADNAGGNVCVKGRDCGLSCINQDNDCIEEFPKEVRNAVKALAKELESVYGSTSEDSKNERVKMLEVLKEPSGEFTNILKKYEGDEEKQLYWARMLVLTTGRERDASDKFQYSPEEITGLNANAEKLSEAWKKSYLDTGGKPTPESLRVEGGIGDYLNSKRTEKGKFDDEDFDMFWNSLPKSVRGTFINSGSPGENAWDGDDYRDESIPTKHGSKGEERGKMMARIYLEQGGRDIYTGELVPLREMDLEHYVPLKLGMKVSEDPMNIGFIRRGINTGRSDQDLTTYINTTLKKELGLEESEIGRPIPEEKLEEVGRRWLDRENTNVNNRRLRNEANSRDWGDDSQVSEEIFKETQRAFREMGKDYYMVRAISEKAVTTMQLPGTKNQIAAGRNSGAKKIEEAIAKGEEPPKVDPYAGNMRVNWMTDKTFRSPKIPKGETVASYTAQLWWENQGDPEKRRMIEKFWEETGNLGRETWHKPEVAKDLFSPEGVEQAQKRAKASSAKLIKSETDKLLKMLGK